MPLRELPDGFAETATTTVPFPSPELPDVTVIQLALLTAVQEHPAGAPTKRVNPVAVADCRLRESLQVDPACVTVNVNPAMVSVPVREAVAVLAATV